MPPPRPRPPVLRCPASLELFIQFYQLYYYRHQRHQRRQRWQRRLGIVTASLTTNTVDPVDTARGGCVTIIVLLDFICNDLGHKARTHTRPSSPTPSALHQKLQRVVLHQLREGLEELSRVGSVDVSMVAGDRNRHFLDRPEAVCPGECPRTKVLVVTQMRTSWEIECS